MLDFHYELCVSMSCTLLAIKQYGVVIKWRFRTRDDDKYLSKNVQSLAMYIIDLSVCIQAVL